MSPARRLLPIALLLCLPAPARAFGEADLAPYFAQGDLAAARARFDAGLYADAAALLARQEPSREVRWLLALALLEAGRDVEAARAFAALAPEYPALADRIAWNEGLARERQGDFPGAAAAYARVPSGSVLADDATLSAARMLRRSGQVLAAASLLAGLVEREAPRSGVGRDVGAEALFLRAEILEQLGRKQEAAADDLRIWSEHALARTADDALQRATALKARPTLEMRVRRARVFLDAHRNQRGTEMMEALLPELTLPEPLACEAEYALGRGYRKLRQHTKAIQTLKPVVAHCTDPDVRARALYILGSSTSIATPGSSVPVYEQLVKEFHDHSFADDGLLYIADLEEKLGRPEKARAALVRLVEEYPAGDYRADALFRLFWQDRKQGELEAALTWVRRLEVEYRDREGTVDVERALYWTARTVDQLRRPIEAVATYEKLVREHPTGYYAMLARGRLAALDPALARDVEADQPDPPAVMPSPDFDVSALASDVHFAAAVELIRLGFPEQADDELWAVDRRAARQRAGSVLPSLVIAYLLDRTGARQAAHYVAKVDLRGILRGRPEGEAALPFRVAYPHAYRDVVVRWASAANVPPDLLQGLMREESSLDPGVVSWAGAVGLTQLMPSTARRVAGWLRLGRVGERQLRDPDLNVRLGAAYLGYLLKMWKGNPALAAASYNAGEGSVKRWLGERGKLEIDEFVEEIPIEETRDYVKRVLTAFNAYRLTYGSGAERYLALAPARADPR